MSRKGTLLSAFSLLALACMLLTTIVWGVSRAWGAATEENSAAEALISRARSQQALWNEGTPPMSLRAQLQARDANGKMVEGAYTLDWVSASQWKETIEIGNYQRLRVGDAKGYYWEKSSLSYKPAMIFQLDSLLHFKEVLRLGPKQTLTEPEEHKKDGVRQQCTEVKEKRGTDRVLCFDEATGSLATIEYPALHNLSLLAGSRIEYDAFKPVAGQLVPYEIQALRGSKMTADVKILEISKMAEKNPAPFRVPKDAQPWANCDNMREAELISAVNPDYPPAARLHHEEGSVTLYGVIEPDGSFSHLALVQSATPALNAAAVRAVSQWRYKPATCGVIPVRVETFIAVKFWFP